MCANRVREILSDPKLREAAVNILASPEATENNKRMARLALKLTKLQVN